MRSSMRGGRTIRFGFSIAPGSKASFTVSNARTIRSPNICGWNSLRARPSPCSPLCEPLYSRTRENVSSAIACMVATSVGSFMFSTGRTCRQPTEACAYQVPLVPCFSNTAFNRSV